MRKSRWENNAMEVNDYLVIAMFLTFITLLFTGFPVAWVLAGVGVLFCGVGYLADIYLGTITGLEIIAQKVRLVILVFCGI